MRQPLKIPHLAGREKPLRELGLSPTDATWLTLVCYHSGVFTRRQYAEIHQCHRMAAHRLVRRLITAGVARERLLPGTSLKVTHVHGRLLYRALGIEKHVRHHRAARPFVVLRRLLCLDHVAEHPSLPWLPIELDKASHFLRRGLIVDDLPQRTYGGALNNTRSYFHHQLPIAAGDDVATFVYADPGRYTDTELRSWINSHRRLWVRLRDAGTRVHVAVVTRTLEAWSDYRRTLDRWLSRRRGGGSFSGGASTPGEQQVLDLIYAALRSGRPTALDPWGGTPANARRIAHDLLERRKARGVPIDSYSTHHADRLAPDSLAR